MKPFRSLLAAQALLTLALAAGPAVTRGATPAATQPPAGLYHVDKAHTSVTLRVNHLGFSHYTARFSRVDGALRFDPAHPGAMHVEASIDPTSLELNTPPTGFHEELMGEAWFAAVKFPQITFRSTQVKLTGAHTAKVTGDLTLHGVTRPVVLDVTYNGGWPSKEYDPGGRVGFSAHGVFKRSAFGIAGGIPAPGSNMGVSDEVEVMIETEFSGKA